MSKVITLRLTDDEYKTIALNAKYQRRPISNFITTTVVREIEHSYYADPSEMNEISRDRKLLKSLAAAHKDAKAMKGKLIG
jgi:hypothetical protein